MKHTDTITISALGRIAARQPCLTIRMVFDMLDAIREEDAAQSAADAPETLPVDFSHPRSEAPEKATPAPEDRPFNASEARRRDITPRAAPPKPARKAKKVSARDWTQEEDDLLKKGLREGKTSRQCAEAYLPGRTAKAAQMRAHAMRKQDPSLPAADLGAGGPVSADAYTEAEDADIRRLIGEGFTFSGIAERLGRTRKSIEGRVIRLGIKQRPHWSDEDREALVDMHAAGASSQEIADALGKSNGSVKAAAHRKGLKFGTRRNPVEAPVADMPDPVTEEPAPVAEIPDAVAETPDPVDETPEHRPGGMLSVPINPPPDTRPSNAVRDYLIFYEARVEGRKDAPLYGILGPDHDYNLALHLSKAVRLSEIAESCEIPEALLRDRYRALLSAGIKDQRGYVSIDGSKVLLEGLSRYAFGETA